MDTRDRLTEIFLKACTIPPQARSEYLDRACAGDAELRSEIEAMLAADARAEAGEGTGALAAPVGRMAAEAAGSTPAPPPIPERIGPYRILELLGEGGMGVVYLAEQTEPVHRQVALKLTRMAIDSAGAVARFESERQTLALMDHSGIARLLDAGATSDARPYFVMELVRGAPITTYCKDGRLDLRARVLLFLDVCRAVRHAHRHGVIHRDLKPSNILITQEGGLPAPKVIDFSIAKALGDPALGTEFRTRTGQLIGTLEYMSPEQALGRAAAVDTRSDVYALGVVLHELLSDRLPHEVTGQPLHEAVRRIAEEPPGPLRGAATTGTGRLDADLETITGKCLEKDPDRRYSSAAELVEDLERYLDSRPIQARPPSTVYQLRKLVGRHRAVFAGMALAMALVLVFSVIVTIQLGVQRRERARAESQAAKAERVIEFLQQTFAHASRELGQEAKIKEALDLASKQLASGATDEAEAEAAIRMALAQAWHNFGQDGKAADLSREAIALLERRLGPFHPDVGAAYQQLGGSLFYEGKAQEARAPGERALAIHEAQRPRNAVLISQDLSLLAVIHLVNGELDPAEAMLRREIGLYGTEIPSDDTSTANLAIAQENLANVLQRRGRIAESASLMKEVLDARRRLGVPDLDIAHTLFNVAFLLDRQGKLHEAEVLFRESAETTRRLAGPGHPDYGDQLRGLGVSLHKQGRYQEAEAVLREAVATYADGKQEHYLYPSMVIKLAAVLGDQDRLTEASRLAEEALRIAASKADEKRLMITEYLGTLGRVHELSGRMGEAEEALRECVAIREASLAGNDLSVGFGLLSLTAFLARAGRFQEALPLGERTLQILTLRLEAESPDLVTAKGWLAVTLDGLGRHPEAEALRADALEVARRLYEGEHPSIGWLLHGRAAALRRQSRHDDALPAVEEALSLRRRLLPGRDRAIADSLLELAEIRLGREETRAATAAARDALAIWTQVTFVDPALLQRAREIAARPR